jgi:oligopeptide/dipeptide ABC transporter ATP-binding protein
MGEALLEVKDLRTYFFTRRGVVKAVDGVSFSVASGETFGLVGESGCGKSITCLSLLRLVPQPAGHIVGGQILLKGENLLEKSTKSMRKIRGRDISMILQDPMISLNPVFSIGFQVREPIVIHQGLRGHRLQGSAAKILRLVGISAPDVRLREFPHELSGGMRQRVVGALALSCQPELLICDEPTTSLDLTIQMQYLDLLKGIQQETGVSMIFVTHDFGIVAEMCDRVGVMYAGRIVELADVWKLYDNPVHPYTQALLKSIPTVEAEVERLISIEGQPPPLYDLPPGCSFFPRCPARFNECGTAPPPLYEAESGHWARCYLLKKDI